MVEVSEKMFKYIQDKVTTHLIYATLSAIRQAGFKMLRLHFIQAQEANKYYKIKQNKSVYKDEIWRLAILDNLVVWK